MESILKPSAQRPTNLLSLPNELLFLITKHLYSIEDYISFTSTCRTIHDAASKTPANVILRLAATSNLPFFRPRSHFLVAATAPSVRSCLLQDPYKIAPFRNALQQGMQGLLDFCVEHGTLTLDRIRALHSYRSRTIRPAVDLVEAHMRSDPYIAPNLESRHANKWLDSHKTLFNLAIYGDLFGGASELDTYLWCAENNESYNPALPLEARLDFVKYCMPQWSCFQDQNLPEALSPDGFPDPLRMVLEVGPYLRPSPLRMTRQSDMAYLLFGRHDCWHVAWASVRNLAGGEIDPERSLRQELWRTLAMQQGLEGFEMLQSNGAEKWKAKLHAWRQQITALGTLPNRIQCGSSPATTLATPYLLGDLMILGVLRES